MFLNILKAKRQKGVDFFTISCGQAIDPSASGTSQNNHFFDVAPNMLCHVGLVHSLSFIQYSNCTQPVCLVRDRSSGGGSICASYLVLLIAGTCQFLMQSFPYKKNLYTYNFFHFVNKKITFELSYPCY